MSAFNIITAKASGFTADNCTDLDSATVYMMPPALLNIEAGYNVRTFSPSDADDSSLMRSIAADGVNTPITVRRLDGKLYVVAGHRRVSAVHAIIANAKGSTPRMVQTVPVMLAPLASGTERLYDLIVSNSGKPLTMLECGTVCARLIQAGEERKDIAKRLGYVTRYVSNLLTLANAPEGIQAAIRAGRMSGTMVYEHVQKAGEGNAEAAYTELLATLNTAAAGAKVTASDVKQHVRKVAAGNAAEGPAADAVKPYTSSKRAIFDGAGVRVAIAESVSGAAELVALLNKGLGIKVRVTVSSPAASPVKVAA